MALRRAVAPLLIVSLAWPVAARAAAAPPVDARAVTDARGVTVTAPSEPEATAESLYEAGEQAYWLGDFRRAVQLFEAAYARSGLPALLYNVGLATMRRYELTQDPEDLRRARAVLTNYAQELLKDPTLQQADNVPKLIAQLDATLAGLATKPSNPASEPAPPAPAIAPTTAPDARCEPDASVRGRDARQAGTAVMTLGGLALAGGVATTLSFALKGQSFQSQQAVLHADQAARGCTGDSQDAACRTLDESLAITASNGRRANLLAGGLGGGLMALGVAGLVIGAIVFTRAPARRADKLAISPSLTPQSAGLIFAGRF
jgi:hypothetical protein